MAKFTINKSFTTEEFLAINGALQAVLRAMEKDEDEHPESSMLYKDMGNFIYSLSEKEYQALKQTVKNHFD